MISMQLKFSVMNLLICCLCVFTDWFASSSLYGSNCEMYARYVCADVFLLSVFRFSIRTHSLPCLSSSVPNTTMYTVFCCVKVVVSRYARRSSVVSMLWWSVMRCSGNSLFRAGARIFLLVSVMRCISVGCVWGGGGGGCGCGCVFSCWFLDVLSVSEAPFDGEGDVSSSSILGCLAVVSYEPKTNIYIRHW